jgi:hypothetical protein
VYTLISNLGPNYVLKWTATTHVLAQLFNFSSSAGATGMTVDSTGNVYYMTGDGTGTINKWTVATQTSSQVAASGLYYPKGIATDVSGKVYFSQSTSDNQAMLGVLQPPSYGFLNPNPLPSTATPAELAEGGTGSLYLREQFSPSPIKKWNGATQTVTTLLASSSGFKGLAVDGADNLYVVDATNNAIKVLPRAFFDPTAKTESSLAGSDTLPVVVGAIDPTASLAATSDQTWLTIGAAGGGALHYSFAVNNTHADRTAHITWLGQQFSVTQLGAPSLVTTGEDLLAGSASMTIYGAGFDPVAANNTVSFSGGAVGTVTAATAASLTISFSTPPTTLGALTAVVTTDGVSSGAPVQVATVSLTLPTFTLGTTKLVEGPAAGTDSVVLAVNPTGSDWLAVANDSWLHISAGSSNGTTNAVAVFTFDANTGATRSGTLTIAGQTLTVTQAGSTYVSAGAVTTLVSGTLSNPYAVAVDSADNVFVLDSGNSKIRKWTASTQTLSDVVSSSSPTGVAVDTAGNVYYIESSTALKKWTAATQTVSTLISSGLFAAHGVAVDSFGNVFVADQTGTGDIVEWNASTQTASQLISRGLYYPQGVGTDISNNLYLSDGAPDNTGILKEVPAGGSSATFLVSSGLGDPRQVAPDGSGNVYIADHYNNAVKKWSAVTQTVSTLVSSGLDGPFGVGVDSVGNIYIADYYNNALKELPRAFVDASAKTESALAGSDALPVVLPSSENLSGLFTPTSDQAWLTIGTTGGGVVSYSVAANYTRANRTAHIALLGQQISVSQSGAPALVVTAATLPAGSITMSISGAGFDPVAANNSVSFNGGVVGTVTAATANSLTISFTNSPANLGALSAVVTTDGVSSGAPVQVATVAFPVPAGVHAEGSTSFRKGR